MICRVCGNSDSGARPGSRCPVDDSILVNTEALKAHPRDVLLGQMVASEFALVDVLGTGAFGTVYKAIQFPVKRPVALKVLHGHFYSNEGVRQRFFQEARAIGSLSDASIVKLIRFGEEPPGKPLPGSPGFYFIAQEFISGQTLRQLTRAEGPLDETRSIAIALQMLRALADAHRHGVIHRDLKPSNIMLTVDALGEEAVKVLDFGVAKMLEEDEDAEEETPTPETLTGLILGTPNYMAPEQIRGEDVGPETDLYAVGVLLFEMLSGTRPFQRPKKTDVLRAQIHTAAPPLPAEVGASAGISRIIQRALSKDGVSRYQTARELIDDLRGLQSAPDYGSRRVAPSAGASSLDEPELATVTDSFSKHALVTMRSDLIEVEASLSESENSPQSTSESGGRSFVISAVVTFLFLIAGWFLWANGAQSDRTSATPKTGRVDVSQARAGSPGIGEITEPRKSVTAGTPTDVDAIVGGDEIEVDAGLKADPVTRAKSTKLRSQRKKPLKRRSRRQSTQKRIIQGKPRGPTTPQPPKSKVRTPIEVEEL